MYKKIIIFLLSFFAVMTTVSAKEYYVDSANGTDNFNYSGSESRPFATIQKAVDTAKAGDIVKKCMQNGVLCLTAKNKVRLLPALNIPMDDLKAAVEVLLAAFAEE